MNFGRGLRVVIVNGKPGCGKSAFEDACIDILGWQYCKQRSTIDKIKEIAREGGWKGQKDLKSRKFLSDLKQLFVEYNDLPTTDVKNFLDGWESELAVYNVGDRPHILFIDDREPKHIDKLRKELNAITLLIRRPGDEDIETSNDSDEFVLNYEYDYTILNEGSLDELREDAKRFINWIFS